MENYYLWAKALHLIAVISWMAGMLYLPRIFVYHADVKVGSEMDEKFKIMEHRLLRYIINPAMIVAFLLGVWLIYIIGMKNMGGWFHIKALLLVFMFGVHGMLSKYRKAFARGENKKSAKFYRILNEVPTVLMVVIVILAVVKPF